jgi:FkbM family methyltransferase
MSIWKPWYICRPSQVLIRAWRAVRHRPRGPKSVRLPWGYSITVDPDQAVGRSIWTIGIYDIAVSEVLARLIHPGDLVLDVGANVGYMSMLMALRTGKSGELISFEPHPALYQSLMSNLNQGQLRASLPRVALHNIALSDTSGNTVLLIPEGFQKNDGIARLCRDGEQGIASIPIRTETLDSILEERMAAVIKVDVEGHELAVFNGAGEALRHQRIRHIVYEDHHGISSAVGSFLRERGYTLFQIGWSFWGPILASAEMPAVCKPYEAPSYLATCDPAAAQQACRGHGWLVLRTMPTV